MEHGKLLQIQRLIILCRRSNAGYGQTGVSYATNQAVDPTSQLKATPLNNLGSVVIDGMLIQHMKIIKGL